MKEKENTSDLQIYELGFHILPTVLESDLSEIVSKIKDLVTENGASVISEGFPRSRQLAYSIEKSSEEENRKWSKAYFGWIKFEIPKENLSSVEESVKKNPQILRFIIVKSVKENTIYYSKSFSDMEKDEAEDASRPQTKEVTQEELDKSIDDLVIN